VERCIAVLYVAKRGERDADAKEWHRKGDKSLRRKRGAGYEGVHEGADTPSTAYTYQGHKYEKYLLFYGLLFGYYHLLT
jgi:hypothetical protein